MELEQALSEDRSGTKAREVLNRLSEYKGWVQQKLAQPLATEVFEAFNKLKIGISQAEEVIRKC